MFFSAVKLGRVYGIDSLLQPASSGQLTNYSLSHFRVGFKRESGRLPLDSNTPHMSTSLCGKICITLHKCIRNERRRSYYSVCSVVAAAGVMFWRRCVSLWKRNYFVWDPKEDTTRNQWLSCVYNTVPEQFNTNIGVCAAHFTESGRVAYNAVCTKTVSIKWSNSSFASDSQPVSTTRCIKRQYKSL